MKTGRRSFLRFLMGLLVVTGDRRPAEAATEPFEIHTGTRNTLLGAIGRQLSRLRPRPLSAKSYPGNMRRSLPPVDIHHALPVADVIQQYAPAVGFTPDGVSLSQISRLLFLTNGITGVLKFQDGDAQIDLRAAPSAGALYAGEVYLVAVRIAGLAPGVYHYHVKNHELVLVQSGVDEATLLAAFENRDPVAHAAAFVVITNVFERYQWQYANRGYRYALIDTGHIGENLRLAAASLGWGETKTDRFQDDLLNQLLAIDGRHEAACAIHALGMPTHSGVVNPSPGRVLVEKQHQHPTEMAPDLPLTQRYHESTKLTPGAPPKTAPISVVTSEPPTLVEAPLPEPPFWPRMSVEQSIRERRSPLAFHSGAIDVGQLAVVLDLAQTPRAHARSTGVDLYVLVNAVDGLERGLYHYRPDNRRLALVRRGDLRRPMVRICLGQKKAGSAAVGCLMVGRLREAASLGGQRRYRELLIESGEIGQRIYLAAESLALSARNLAAFRDDGLNALLGFNGRDLAVVHLTMLGHGA